MPAGENSTSSTRVTPLESSANATLLSNTGMPWYVTAPSRRVSALSRLPDVNLNPCFSCRFTNSTGSDFQKPSVSISAPMSYASPATAARHAHATNSAPILFFIFFFFFCFVPS